MKLSKEQMKQISSFISLNLKDIKEYIKNNKNDYEKWLQEKENIRIKKIYTRYKIWETIDKSSLKIRKIYKSNDYHYVIWNCYPF